MDARRFIAVLLKAFGLPVPAEIRPITGELLVSRGIFDILSFVTSIWAAAATSGTLGESKPDSTKNVFLCNIMQELCTSYV
jgi:hypothetical protein